MAFAPKAKKIYLLFKGFQKLHVDLQFPSQLFKSPRPVLMLSVPVLNGLTQPLREDSVTGFDSYSPCWAVKVDRVIVFGSDCF